MAHPTTPLDTLLSTLHPRADLVHRHLWLITLMDWLRQAQGPPDTTRARLEMLLSRLDAQPALRAKLREFWHRLVVDIDGSSLLSDYGFASRNAFLSELLQRINRKWLPRSPLTTDAAELFDMAMPTPQDAVWITALDAPLLTRLATLLSMPAHSGLRQTRPDLTWWQDSLIDAMTFCTSQIRATGFSPELRLRMSAATRKESPFHALASSFDAVRDAWLAGEGVEEAARDYKLQLEACRHAAASVYEHLDACGISVDLVFRLRQLRERILRTRALLDCLLDDAQHSHTARLWAQLAALGQSRRSVGVLLSASASLLAAKVAERNSETGEHYIARSRAEYRTMLGRAAGGGAITALTTALKFAVLAMGLTAFWYGFWAGLVYAASFVLIQLLHFTLATKQPAMTAPAMAARLKDLTHSAAINLFVDEVAHLVRSQTASVIGNVAVVFPVTVLLTLGIALLKGAPMVSSPTAHHVLDSLNLWGPSALFAAMTGVLLFASSMFAGWVENWFVLHRLDSALRYNPRITRALGVQRADRWAGFWRHHISGFAANVSLGMMLGLVPAVLAFLAIPLDVRHVTLSAGQIGAACASLGWAVLSEPALWWAVAALPVIGLCNVGVSFFLAFRVALRAHEVSAAGRTRIYTAIALRLRTAPLRFVWPAANS